METWAAYAWAFGIVITVMFFPQQSMRTAVNSAWYKNIRPAATPPNYVFPIVWTILYYLIGVALAQTLQLPKWTDTVTTLLYVYGFNLICNVLWSFAYFGSRDVALALVILAAIVISTALLLYYTYLLLPLWVVGILVPYQLWVIFALYLNAASLYKIKKN
uniref:TspO/MBR family protein n=1 Tax=viral metagenome TaxID=1070528 RepID=A0A6C0EKR1_9ZZZZ